MSVLAPAVESPVLDAPWILSFPDSATLSPPVFRQDVVTRTRLLHRNSTCLQCGRATVDPVELDDALLNRWGHDIPGTASIAGFSCNTCGNEWSSDTPPLRVFG